MKKQTVNLTRILLLGAVVLSCAKERPFEALEGKPVEAFDRSALSIEGQQQAFDKDGKATDQLVNGKTKYLYLKSTHGAPRKVIEADPYFQGQQKLVQAEWTKDGLLLSEIEPESKFEHVPENFHPTILIPGDYLSYRCVTDANGECQNKEEEDPSVDWSSKKYFVPKFADVKDIEVNDLDIFGVEGIFNAGCINSVHTVVTNYEVNADGVNFELEKFYKVANRFECLIDQFFKDQTGALGFRMKYFYSIVRLDKLASPDYVTVDYPVPDHDKFGFFTTEKRTFKDDNNPNTKARSYTLQRFNPNKKVITYYLSDTFKRPENASIKQASYDAVDSINESLRRAEAGIQIELKEPAGKMAGDLRNNMLVLIDHYLDNGLLGYGPSVPNPLTGEIVQAHVNMYSGVLRSMTRRVWAEMVDLSKAEAAAKKAAEVVSPVVTDTDPGVVVPEEINLEVHKFSTSHKINKMKKEKLNAAKIKNLTVSNQALKKEKQLFTERAKKQVDLKNHVHNLGEEGVGEEFRVALEKMSERCMYHEEFINVGGTAKTLFPGVVNLPGVLSADGTLKEYNELSEDSRKAAADLIIVHTYKTTLVHEFGHNLGLRHNFQGSFDKANFYSEEEAKQLGMRAAPAYSSIMDYGASELNELGAFGKYDVAALKYGYSRKIDVIEKDEEGKEKVIPADISAIGSITAYQKTAASLPLKDYAFCTDGNAGLNTPCNRFDEGTNLVEITQGLISTYKSSYKMRNLRDERLDFIDLDIDLYAARVIRSFKAIRNVYEDLEFYLGIMELVFANNPKEVIDSIKAYTAENGCVPQLLAAPNFKDFCDRTKDAVDATKIAATFLMDTVKAPDHTCFTEQTVTPGIDGLEVFKLDENGKQIEPEVVSGSFKLGKKYTDDLRFDDAFENSVPTTCFDPRLTKLLEVDGIKVVAENGKMLNDIKDPNPEFKYSNDIYVRGTWVDKLTAMKFLTTRRSGRMSTEDNYGALIDLPYVREDMVNVLAHMVSLDEALVAPVAATLADGSKKVFDYKLTTEDKVPEVSYYLGRFKKFFRLDNSDESLNSLLFTAGYDANTFTIPNVQDYRFVRDLVTIERADANLVVRPEFLPFTVENRQYYALPNNVLGRETLETIFLSKLATDEKQAALAKAAHEMRTKTPEGLSAEEAKAYILPLDLLDQALAVVKGEAKLPADEVILTILGEELGGALLAAVKLEEKALTALMTLKEKTENKVPTKSQVAAELKEDYEELAVYFSIGLEKLENALADGIPAEKVEKALEALEYTYLR